MKSDETVINVDGLTKKYDSFVAVDAINFGVRRGEFFGFLGPNGAGKTTTIRMLTGVLVSDSGKATIFGEPAGSLRARQRCGVVPEMANAYMDLSALDNMLLMADLYGVPRKLAHSRTLKIIEELGLGERLKSLVRTYSKGMRQRLILAMALISEPELLFLDEPTSGLDVQSSRLIKNILVRLNKQGTTIFLTTHDMEEANQLCERVAIINRGKLVAVDSPQKIKLAAASRQSLEVSFSGTVDESALAAIQGVQRIEQMGDKFLLHTSAAGETAMGVMRWADSSKLGIVSISCLTPSLEEGFVALTGQEAPAASAPRQGMGPGRGMGMGQGMGRGMGMGKGMGMGMGGGMGGGQNKEELK